MEAIKKIKEYFLSMEVYEGKWVMSVKYGPKWRAYASSDGRIKVSKDDSDSNVWWYYASDDSVDVDDIINLVTETIATNIEAAKKVELFKEKAEELKKLFANESLTFEKLKSLKFIYDKPVKLAGIIPSDSSVKVNDTSENEELDVTKNITTNEKTEDLVKTSKPKKPKKTKKSETVDEVGITPDKMTQDEIDKLRG